MTEPIIDSSAWGRSLPDTIAGEIRDVQAGDKPAVDRFYRRYGTPAFCYLRACGADRETAKDLTQVVMAKLLCGRPLAHFETARLKSTDPGSHDVSMSLPDTSHGDTTSACKGGSEMVEPVVTDKGTSEFATSKSTGAFRPYFKRALANEYRSHKRQMDAAKRNPPEGIASLDKILEDFAECWVPARDENPEEVFDRQYSCALLNAAIARLQRDCMNSRFELHFILFVEKWLLNPPRTYLQIGAGHDMTEGQATTKVRTILQRLGRALHNELEKMGMTDAEIDEEIKDLIKALQQRSRRLEPS